MSGLDTLQTTAWGHLTLHGQIFFFFWTGKTRGPPTDNHLGEWEHIVVSYIKQAIPQPVQEAWHSWRSSMKKAEGAVEGGEGAEPAGWGVEEADARNKKEASTSFHLPSFTSRFHSKDLLT